MGSRRNEITSALATFPMAIETFAFSVFILPIVKFRGEAILFYQCETFASYENRENVTDSLINSR